MPLFQETHDALQPEPPEGSSDQHAHPRRLTCGSARFKLKRALLPDSVPAISKRGLSPFVGSCK
jgi:hypothetical protein